jgi:hypothetical protein
MAKFTGEIRNDFPPQVGVNMVVKGIEDEKVVVAPNGPTMPVDKEVKGNTLTFTVAPSSGGTEEPRALTVEVKNGSEKVTAAGTHWEVEITSSSSPTEFTLSVVSGDY